MSAEMRYNLPSIFLTTNSVKRPSVLQSELLAFQLRVIVSGKGTRLSPVAVLFFTDWSQHGWLHSAFNFETLWCRDKFSCFYYEACTVL